MAIRKKTSLETALDPTLAMETPVEQPEKEKKTVSAKLSKAAALDVLKGQLSQRIAVVFDLLDKEVSEIEEQKKKMREEIETAQREWKQKEEQDNLTSLLTQKKRQAEFEEKLLKERKTFEEETARRESELAVRADELKKQETELAGLREKVGAFPNQLEKQTAEAVKQSDAETKREFDFEKKMLQQKFDSDIRLLNQQLIATQNQIKTLEKENLSLKTEKNKAVDQMKDLAVAVVRGKEENTPTQSTPSNP